MEANQYRELTAQELEQLRPLFKEGALVHYARIGPKGYLFLKDYCDKHAADILNMELKEGDIFVTSYQRSGTTWTQELVWLIVNNFDYDKAAAVPLTRRYAFLEMASMLNDKLDKGVSLNLDKESAEVLQVMATPATKILAETPSPRFVKTHLPMSLLPDKLLDTAKVIYVARDPRDVIVSSYHHAHLFKTMQFVASFRQMWDAFRNDLYLLTPYFEHVKEAWALRQHPNMLFIFYEDLKMNLPASIRRISDFLGREVPPDQIERLCDHLNIKHFKNNKSVNSEELRGIGLLDSKETFIRKGKSGGWRDYFDEEMTREAEKWIAAKLRDTDLIFPSMANNEIN